MSILRAAFQGKCTLTAVATNTKNYGKDTALVAVKRRGDGDMGGREGMRTRLVDAGNSDESKSVAIKKATIKIYSKHSHVNTEVLFYSK